MKTMNFVSRMLTIAAIASSFIIGCNRADSLDNDTAESMLRQSSDVESNYDDMQCISDQAFAGSISSFKNGDISDITSGCATITRDDVAKTILIDFGTTNCTGNDGRDRRGKILVTYTGAYREVGTVITISPDNYFVNDNQIAGTKVIKNLGDTDGDTFIEYQVTTNGTVTLADNKGTITFTADKYREWVAGEATEERSDDEYNVWGTGAGTHTDGKGYTAVVDEANPLHRIMGCRHWVSGILNLTPTGKPTRSIDFGNGTCDDKAVVTVNGRSINITLRHRRF